MKVRTGVRAPARIDTPIDPVERRLGEYARLLVNMPPDVDTPPDRFLRGLSFKGVDLNGNDVYRVTVPMPPGPCTVEPPCGHCWYCRQAKGTR